MWAKVRAVAGDHLERQSTLALIAEGDSNAQTVIRRAILYQ